MKNLILLGILMTVVASASGQSAAASSDFDKLNWLEGTWSRTNAKPGRSGTERWIKSEGEWQGWGVSMKGSDTLFVEKLKLVIKDEGIFYVADVPENKKLVYFKLTQVTETGFECENPQHDFPKKITYRKEGPILRATISGDSKSVEYLFEKK